MKLKRFCFGLLLVAVIFVGCKQNVDLEPKYTVWTDVTAYSEIEGEVDLKDGYYIRTDISDDLFNEKIKGISDKYKHNWTEDEVKKWFIGRGFGEAEAIKETSWLVTINHGILLTRTGNVVYMILK